MQYEKIVGMKVVDGKIQFIRQTFEIPEETDETTEKLVGLSHGLAKGTYATKIMRPMKDKETT